MKRWLSLPLALLVLLLAAASSEAAFKLRIDDDPAAADGFEVTVTDLGGDGFLSFTSTSLSGFSLVDVDGVSKPAVSDALHLNTLNVTSSGTGGTMVIELTDTDFTLSLLAESISWLTIIGGVTDGTVVVQAWVTDSNTEFDTASGTVAGPITYGPGTNLAFADTIAGSTQALTDPFSATIRITITHTGAQQTTSLDVETTVPEPGTLGLLGLGLLAASSVAWRRGSR